jgi:hypothetical protein
MYAESILQQFYLLTRHLVGENKLSSFRSYLNQSAGARTFKNEFYIFDDCTSVAEIKLALKKQVPFVIKNGAANWPCMSKWSLDFLSERYGHQEVLTDIQATDIKVDFKKAQRVELSTLDEYIAEIKGETKKYLRFAPFIQNNKELEQDLDLSWLSQFKSFHAQGPIYHFFLGRSGSRSRLHCANSDNFFTQVIGKKNWLLLPPNAFFAVHPQNYRSALNFESDLDLRGGVDHNRYPLAAKLSPIEVTCEEGDILYIPPYYWHDVLNESISLGVSTRYISALSGIKASPLMFLLNFLGTNPSIFNMNLNEKLNESLYQRKSHGHNV